MTRLTPQLPLDLGHRPAFERDAFLVAPANEAAVAWIDRWPGWPAPGLVLQGPSGSGKTHLASVWRARAGAGLVEGAALTAAMIPTLLDAGRELVVENAQAAPEEPLLHLYNGIAERSGHLLLTASEPPARWGVALADLRSRLNALPMAELGVPDEALIRAVLVKLFADRQLKVTVELIDYIGLRIERSFDTARRVVAALDRVSLAARRRITIPLAQKVLEELGAAGEGEEP
jgi:chromosomal replication initiation ATPase DnaA